MTNPQPFVYDDNLMDECVLENTSTQEVACHALFRLFSTHYGRELNPDRFQRFVESVHLVHDHNKRSDVSHRITLNQFSDLPLHELPLASPLLSDVWNYDADLDGENVVLHLGIDDFVPTENAHEDRRRLKEHHRWKVKAPANSTIVWASRESSVVVNEMKNHHVKINAKKQHEQVDTDSTNGIFPVTDSDFDQHLNWATSENPDRVSIVHSPSDQVRIMMVFNSCNVSVSAFLTLLQTGALRELLGLCCNWDFRS